LEATLKRILTIADSHTGGVTALFPPKFSEYPLNKFQEYLWRCWVHMCRHLPPLDVIILMAEQTEGTNPKGEGVGICEPDETRQVEAARRCLDLPLAKLKEGGEIHVLTGNKYHVGTQAQQSKALAVMLAAEGYNVSRDALGHAAHAWLHLDLEGVLLDIAHLQTATIVNRAMPLEREIKDMLTRAADEGEPPDDIIIRAHTHNVFAVNEGYRYAIACPPWKLQDGFAAGSRTPNRWRSKWVGSWLIETDGAAKARGDDPVKRLVKYFYPAPKIERCYCHGKAQTPDDDRG
jgi:hypothetical protein